MRITQQWNPACVSVLRGIGKFARKTEILHWSTVNTASMRPQLRAACQSSSTSVTDVRLLLMYLLNVATQTVVCQCHMATITARQCLLSCTQHISQQFRWNHPTTMRNHMPYGIIKCYLPPGSGHFPAFTPAKTGTRFSDCGGMQGWVDLGRGSQDSLPDKDGYLSQK